MSKQGKQLRPVLFHPKKVAGQMLIHRLNLNMPLEKIARRNKNKQARISRATHRKRKPHGRS